MNIKNRICLSAFSCILLGSGCWVVLLPHLIFQYALITLTSAMFGVSLFAITDTEDKNDISNLEEEVKELKKKKEFVEKEKEKNMEYTNNTNNLYREITKIINPSVRKRFLEIYELSSKINDYGISHNCMDKLNVWNIVYVGEICRLLTEYNHIVSIPDTSNKIIKQITEFEDLSKQILEKFSKQYDDLISGHIETFEIDMSLVKQLSEK